MFPPSRTSSLLVLDRLSGNNGTATIPGCRRGCIRRCRRDTPEGADAPRALSTRDFGAATSSIDSGSNFFSRRFWSSRPLCIRRTHPAVLRLQAIEGLLADAVTMTHLCRRHSASWSRSTPVVCSSVNWLFRTARLLSEGALISTDGAYAEQDSRKQMSGS